MNFSPKNIGIVVAAIVVLGGLYWYFFMGSSSATSATLTAGAQPNAVETQFLTLTSELSPISFDTKVFSDPRFTALVDITTPVTSEPVGRTDPFAPVTSSGNSQSSSSSQ